MIKWIKTIVDKATNAVEVDLGSRIIFEGYEYRIEGIDLEYKEGVSRIRLRGRRDEN